jgi:hypothetical protein
MPGVGKISAGLLVAERMRVVLPAVESPNRAMGMAASMCGLTIINEFDFNNKN